MRVSVVERPDRRENQWAGHAEEITRIMSLGDGAGEPVRLAVTSFHICSLRRCINRRIFACDGGKSDQATRRQGGTGPMTDRFQITGLSGS